MAQLDRQIKAQHPGVVIGWIGDAAHAQTVSDHNPDDTPGVRAAQTDSDSLQEVRALDVMRGPAFSVRDADQLVRDLVSIPAHRARLDYVIWNRQFIGRDTHWTIQPYHGNDPHTNHVHVSGWAGDDANTAPWAIGGDMSTAEVLAALRDPEPIGSDGVQASAEAAGEGGQLSLRTIAEYGLEVLRYGKAGPGGPVLVKVVEVDGPALQAIGEEVAANVPAVAGEDVLRRIIREELTSVVMDLIQSITEAWERQAMTPPTIAPPA